MSHVGGNFEAEVYLVDDDWLQVLGASFEFDGGDIVARRVALQQPPSPSADGMFIEEGDPAPGPQWDIRLSMIKEGARSQLTRYPVPAPKFVEGPALAIGIETYFVPAFPREGGGAAAYVTLTWSQPVTICKRTGFAQVPPPRDE